MKTPDYEMAAMETIAQATERIPLGYMQLPVFGKESPLYRERVYCYELYHQMRIVMDEMAVIPHSLTGEVDKVGCPIFRDTFLDRAKPDILIHGAGTMDNLCAIEVKPVNGKYNGFRKDLMTLTAMRRLEHVAYKVAVLLVYGPNATEAHLRELLLQASHDKRAEGMIDITLIRFFWHREAKQQAGEFFLE